MIKFTPLRCFVLAVAILTTVMVYELDLHSSNIIHIKGTSSTKSSVKLVMGIPEDKYDRYVYDHMVTKGEVTFFTDSDLNISKYANDNPIIPHIIHQYWDDYDAVPQVYINYIKTVIEHHPNWEYWFLTNADVDCYFKTKHPEFEKVYQNYSSPIAKADVMRYFILYDYGGIYLDLDMEVLKPLDIWTYISPCILSHETYEHSFIIHKTKAPNVINAAMASKPGHPLFHTFQKHLEHYHKVQRNNLLFETGPFFMNNIYHLFLNTSKRTVKDELIVIDPKYWFPTFDPVTYFRIALQCDEQVKYYTRIIHNIPEGRTMDDGNRCINTICERQNTKLHYSNKPLNKSYMNHHWVHTNVKPPTFKTRDTASIFTVAPNLIRVSKKLNISCPH